MKTEAVRIHETGGADKMRREEITLSSPAADEALVRHEAIGVNFIDVYHRTGLYPQPLPAVLGLEAAGVVEAAGEKSGVSVGERVGYCVAGLGAYAKHRLVKGERLIRLPDDIGFEQAAALLLKGMTVEYLIRRAYPVRAKDTVLWHAVAGGVGLIACQWLKQLGVRIIGTAGNEEKATLAKAHGCDEVILYDHEDVATRVCELTDGKGVPVAFDSVGAATFEGTLNSLAPRGVFVSFGNASGAVGAFEPSLLAQKGSLFFTPSDFDDLLRGTQRNAGFRRRFIFCRPRRFACGNRLASALNRCRHRPSRFGISPNHRRYGAFTLIFAAPYLQNYR